MTVVQNRVPATIAGANRSDTSDIPGILNLDILTPNSSIAGTVCLGTTGARLATCTFGAAISVRSGERTISTVFVGVICEVLDVMKGVNPSVSSDENRISSFVRACEVMRLSMRDCKSISPYSELGPKFSECFYERPDCI